MKKKNKKDKKNTITLLPVFKDDVFSTGGHNQKKWSVLGGDISAENTILSPVGYNYDKAGVIRSIILGLRLSEIASDENKTHDSNFVSYTLAQYMRLCFSLGIKKDGFEKFEKRYLPAKDFGIILISTTKGIMIHTEAKKKNMGGILFAYCY